MLMNISRFLISCLSLLVPSLPLSAWAIDGKISVAVGTVTLMPAGGGGPPACGRRRGPSRFQRQNWGSLQSRGLAHRTVRLYRIAENSEVLIETLEASDTTPKVLLDLKAGSMGALIKPQAQTAMDFKVKTPSGVAAARGTFFSVAVEDGKGFVQVKEGKVDVTPADAKVTAPQPGRATVVIGDVREIPPGGAERPLKVGDTVQQGSTVKTGGNSRAVVTMTSNSAVRDRSEFRDRGQRAGRVERQTEGVARSEDRIHGSPDRSRG